MVIARKQQKSEKTKKQKIKPIRKRHKHRQPSIADGESANRQMKKSICKISKGNKNYPILKGEVSYKLSVEMIMYKHTQIHESKIVGNMILDECGRVLFCDKTANEHFEGYLNNFGNKKVWEFVLAQVRIDLINCLNSQMNSHLMVSFLIYSKNSKRKHDLSPTLQQPTNYDYFFRYMKALTTRITCIEMNFANTHKINSFWNTQILTVSPQIAKCFLLETTIASAENVAIMLDNCDLHSDVVLKKFQQKAIAKRRKLGIENRIDNRLLKTAQWIRRSKKFAKKWQKRQKYLQKTLYGRRQTKTQEEQVSIISQNNHNNQKYPQLHQKQEQQLRIDQTLFQDYSLQDQFQFLPPQKFILSQEIDSVSQQQQKVQQKIQQKNCVRQIRKQKKINKCKKNEKQKKKKKIRHNLIEKRRKKLNNDAYDQNKPIQMRKFIAYYEQSDDEPQILPKSPKILCYRQNPYYLSQQEILRQQKFNINDYLSL